MMLLTNLAEVIDQEWSNMNNSIGLTENMI